MKKIFSYFYFNLVFISIFFSLFLTFNFLNVSKCFAENSDRINSDIINSDSILDKVQNNYKNIKTIIATFNQHSHSEALGEDEKSSGVFKALIPNNIKVEYKMPKSQVYLITDKELTFINDSDMQVVKDNADSVLKSKVPLTFLAGVGDVRKDFKILKINIEKDAYKFDLEPKDEGEIESLSLWIDKKAMIVNKLFVKELGANTILFELSDIVVNKNVSDKDFKIDIPKGYDLIDNRN